MIDTPHSNHKDDRLKMGWPSILRKLARLDQVGFSVERHLLVLESPRVMRQELEHRRLPSIERSKSKQATSLGGGLQQQMYILYLVGEFDEDHFQPISQACAGLAQVLDCTEYPGSDAMVAGQPKCFTPGTKGVPHRIP